MNNNTSYPEIFCGLLRPFEPSQIKKRPQGGATIEYITARSVMNRLDDVLGPENWWVQYFLGPDSVKCDLSIRLPDGTVVTKSDVGAYTLLKDEGDNDKGGVSDALKRAAVLFGVGRHLYRDGLPAFAETVFNLENLRAYLFPYAKSWNEFLAKNGHKGLPENPYDFDVMAESILNGGVAEKKASADEDKIEFMLRCKKENPDWLEREMSTWVNEKRKWLGSLVKKLSSSKPDASAEEK